MFQVDNGVETPDGHRFRVNVVEASNISRPFNELKKTDKEKYEEDQICDRKTQNVSFS